MTQYESTNVAIIRVNGEAVASATTTVVNGAADFYGDVSESRLTSIRLDEILIPAEHPEFNKWNALVGQTCDPETIFGKFEGVRKNGGSDHDEKVA